MRAAVIRDGELVVAEHPDPEPGSGEILVRVRAAGINGADMLQKAGHYRAAAGLARPTSPGSSSPARSSACGPGAERFAEGDRVMAIVGGGGQAELCTVHERQAMPVPAGLELARRPAGCPRCSPPPTTRCSPRAGCAPASACSSTAPPAASARAAVQLGASAGAHVTATVRNAGHRARASPTSARTW